MSKPILHLMCVDGIVRQVVAEGVVPDADAIRSLSDTVAGEVPPKAIIVSDDYEVVIHNG